MKKQILNIADILPGKVIRLTRNNHIFYCIVSESISIGTDIFYKENPQMCDFKPIDKIYKIRLEIVCPFIEIAKIARYPAHGMGIIDSGGYFIFYTYGKAEDFFYSLLDDKCLFRIFESDDSEVLGTFEDEIKIGKEAAQKICDETIDKLSHKIGHHSKLFLEKKAKIKLK